MIKVFIFSLVVCSAIEQKCIPITTATKVFETYRDCALYGYQHSHDLLNEKQVYTTFVCKPTSTV